MKTTPDTRAIAIRAIRAQLGITRPALARLLEVSTSSVKSWELGFRTIDARTMAAIVHLTCIKAGCQHDNWDEYFDKCQDCGKTRELIEPDLHCGVCATKLIGIRRGTVCPQCLADELEQINALSTL